jgi:hypothetical protein
MAAMLVPIMFNFTCRSIAEIRWFHPRLLNESMTLAEFVEWEEELLIIFIKTKMGINMLKYFFQPKRSI